MANSCLKDLTKFSVLLDVLCEEDKPLEMISSTFRMAFPEAEHFHVGCALYLLLQDRSISLLQRFAAFYVLYDLYASKHVVHNPFLPVFVDSLQLQTLELCERNFLVQLLSSTPPRGRTPNELSISGTATLPLPDLQGLRAAYMERIPVTGNPLARLGINRSIPDPEDDPNSEPGTLLPVVPSLEGLDLTPFEPLWSRPVPSLSDAREHELVWLDVPSDYSVLWDGTMLGAHRCSSEVRTLMTSALKNSLTTAQQEFLVEELENDSKLVYHCGITPKRLPDLVENNPTVAIEVLLKLMPSAQISEYFSVLVNMDLSLHSMEVVSRLTTQVELPSEFIHLYISNCIQSCLSIKDKYMQNRLVRLVCVFLQTLVRNNIVNARDLFIEVQSFCIEFSKIREAASLFKLLRTMESSNPESKSPSSP